MGRKARVDRSPEEKWQIVQEGIKSGNVSETCRRHGIAPNLFYRWKDEAEQGAKAALGGRSAAAAETEKDHRIRQLERTLGGDGFLHVPSRRGNVGHHTIVSVLQESATRGPSGPALRRTDRCGLPGKA